MTVVVAAGDTAGVESQQVLSLPTKQLDFANQHHHHHRTMQTIQSMHEKSLSYQIINKGQ
jgi:hypothetical protein